jgi:hypothetical protein
MCGLRDLFNFLFVHNSFIFQIYEGTKVYFLKEQAKSLFFSHKPSAVSWNRCIFVKSQTPREPWVEKSKIDLITRNEGREENEKMKQKTERVKKQSRETRENNKTKRLI